MSPADDLHRRATDWINRFGAGEPPRDVAVHARYCDECQRAIRAVDLLLNVDVGGSALPAVEPIVLPARPLAPRLVVGGASLFVLVMAGLTVMDGMQTIAINASPTPAQGVLGGGGSPAPSPLPQDDETAHATRSPDDPTPPPGPPLVAPPPSLPVGPSLPGSTLPGQPTDTEPPPSASADATRAPISQPPSVPPSSAPPSSAPPSSAPPSSEPSAPASEESSAPPSTEASPSG
jgi:hypothetical protein